MPGSVNCYTVVQKPAVIPKPAPKPAPKPIPPPSNSTSNVHNSTNFMPHNKNKKPVVIPAKPDAPPPPPVKSNPTTVYLISGIGALIFVILVGLCLCKKNQKA